MVRNLLSSCRGAVIFRLSLSILILSFFSGSAQATDLSLISGFYKKSAPDVGNGSSQFSLGARLGFGSSQQSRQWFAQANFASTSYSGDGAPAGETSLALGGGQIYFLKNFGGARSYLSWLLAFQNNETSNTNVTKLKSSGLFYGGNAGFRFDLSKDFFLDLNAQLFTSALVATDTVETSAGGTTTKTETKRTEIYLDTLGGVNDLTIGLGLEF